MRSGTLYQTGHVTGAIHGPVSDLHYRRVMTDDERLREFARLIRDDITRWGKIVKDSGAKID